ncbi:YdcF family protein [Paenibacillus xylanexedens]|uniref:YdcF family protein n=2 Tax=Paenibacillus TaxID=44249 RepID=UPI000FE18378|nr:YdcF family protein [Paenibacillus xylanexedens]
MSDKRKPKLKRMILIFLASIVGGGFVWACITAWLIMTYSEQASTRISDAAIILGAAVVGNEPSPVFRERIEHAILLYHQGAVSHLLFTGGAGSVEQRTEAEVGRDYAIAHGVDPADIQLETESHITEENFTYSIGVGEQAGFQTYTIVSDPLHMKRSMMLASGLGMDVVPSPTRTTAYQTWRSKLPFLVRETVLYMGYVCKGWIDNPQQP